MGRTGNHRHWIPGRVLSQVRHVPPEFPASRVGELRELPQRLHHPAGILSGEIIRKAFVREAAHDIFRRQDRYFDLRLTIDRPSVRPNVFVWLTNYRNYLTTTTRSSRISTRGRWRSITPSIIRLTSPT